MEDLAAGSRGRRGTEPTRHEGWSCPRTRSDVAAACGAEGIRVELLTGDDGGMNPHLAVQQGNRLLVSVDDAERVRAIVDRQSASPV